MFNLLLSLSPLLYISYWFFSRKKSESISYDINNGYKCYGCKKDIDSFDNRMEQLGKTIMSTEAYDKLSVPTRCKSCERDIKLNHLTKPLGFRYKIMSDIDKFLVSKKYKKFMFVSLSIIMSCLILDLFLLRELRIFFYTGQLVQLIYWILFIRLYKITTIKKPNQ